LNGIQEISGSTLLCAIGKSLENILFSRLFVFLEIIFMG